MSFVTNLISFVVLLLAILTAVINLNIPQVNEFLIRRAFDRFEGGVFCMRFPDNSIWKFGDLDGINGDKCDNTMTIVNKDETFIGLIQGSIGIGRTYFEGHWKVDTNEGEPQDLADLFTHLVYNIKVTSSPLGPILRNFRLWDWQEYWNRIGLTKDKEIDMYHVRQTYFDTKFYEYMLDESMTYTCGLWTKDTKTLFQSQMNKINVMLHKLQLNLDTENGLNEGNILDVGSGWGFLASTIHNRSAEGKFNVTGITLANEQHDYAYRMFGNGNGNKKTPQSPYYAILDFRDLINVYGENFFDGIISVGVISHIHIKRLEQWFTSLYKVLKPGGSFVMQGIVATQAFSVPGVDDHFTTRSKACTGYNFMGKYIFPGGCVILGDWLQEYAAKAGFINMHREHIAQHYTRTLHEWRMNLVTYKDQILGKDILNGNLQFYRMYEIYLAHCEAAYRAGTVSKGQFVFYKPKTVTKGKWIHTQAFDEFKYEINIPVLDQITIPVTTPVTKK